MMKEYKPTSRFIPLTNQPNNETIFVEWTRIFHIQQEKDMTRVLYETRSDNMCIFVTEQAKDIREKIDELVGRQIPVRISGTIPN